MEFSGLLTAVVFAPALGAILILCVGNTATYVRVVAGLTVLVELALSVAVFIGYDSERADIAATPHMCSAAKFDRVVFYHSAHGNHADFTAVFLAK